MRPYLKSRLLSPLRHAALLYLLGTSSQAQVSAWLDFDGRIPGESKSVSHPGWIEIQGFNLGGELKALKPGALGLTKPLDRASPKLHQACAQGITFDKATLDLKFPSAVTTENPGPARIELENIVVSANAVSQSGDGPPLETFELSFGRIVYTYVEKDMSVPVTASVDFSLLSGPGDGGGGGGASPDTDNDGLPDAWENTYGLSVGVNDANADADGDGLTNLQEYQLGTHPKSGTSFFRASLSPVAGMEGLFKITWNSVVGKIYLIEWTPDLVTPFTTLRTVTATLTTSTEDIVNTSNRGFYRVRPQ